MTNTEIPHVLILSHSKGFVAYIRYTDPTRDKNLSAASWKGIHKLIDGEVLGND